MKTTYDVFTLNFLMICLPGIHSLTTTVAATTSSSPQKASAYGQFALELLVEVSGMVESQQNVVVSPLSVWSVLMPIMEGASGQTLKEMKSSLHLDTDKQNIHNEFQKLQESIKINQPSSVEVESANSVFTDINHPIKEEFQKTVQEVYNSHIFPINFDDVNKAVMEINSWVSNVTHNRIKDLVQADDLKNPNLILTNAVYFKGLWKYPFQTADTFEDDFYDEKEKLLGKVQMMTQTEAFLFGFVNEVEAQILVLPYMGDKFSMVLVLPQEKVSLHQVLEQMKLLSFEFIYNHLGQLSEDELGKVLVFLPRFDIQSKLLLNGPLQNLGIKDAFTNNADFKLISAHNPYLSKVIHKAEIEVTEEGTTASAATGGIYISKMIPPSFKANRPFAYFIIENRNKNILFAGRYSNPVKT